MPCPSDIPEHVVWCSTSRVLKNRFDHPPSRQEGGKNLYLRDTLRLPALRQAQDRRRGFAPLHSPFFSSLLDPLTVPGAVYLIAKEGDGAAVL